MEITAIWGSSLLYPPFASLQRGHSAVRRSTNAPSTKVRNRVDYSRLIRKMQEKNNLFNGLRRIFLEGTKEPPVCAGGSSPGSPYSVSHRRRTRSS